MKNERIICIVFLVSALLIFLISIGIPFFISDIISCLPNMYSQMEGLETTSNITVSPIEQARLNAIAQNDKFKAETEKQFSDSLDIHKQQEEELRSELQKQRDELESDQANQLNDFSVSLNQQEYQDNIESSEMNPNTNV